jgi:NAD(P)H-hydrate epimerase
MTASDEGALALLGTGKLRAVAFGPGLADTQRSRDWLLRLIGGATPLVLDAGALALFDGPQDLFASAVAPMVLTPHAGEFARLFGPPGPDPVAAVRAAAVVAGGVVVLKGRETIIAAPDGQVAINTHATPWLATAGSGDVLTGIIAALLAQGLTPFEAAQAGAWLHGDAGLRAGAGMIADDIPGLLPAVLAGL